MKRILVYSHDTFGLGNIRRMLAIAEHLVEASKEVSVLVVTGSPMLHAFRIPDRVDYLKLPCLSRSVEGAYGSRSLRLPLGETVRLRANIIRSAIEDFRPDLILVDKKPFGVENELAVGLASISDRKVRPKMALLLRDILDSPAATIPVWRKHRYFEAIESIYDAVLVVGTQEIFDLRREYRFPPRAAKKVHFCGYIARPAGRSCTLDIRRDLALREGERLVLVTPGGGQDGYALVDACLSGMESASAARRFRVHIVTGPEMHASQRADVHARVARLARASSQEFSDDMMSLVAAADVVVSMGGYNTVCEILALRKRAVVVPRVKPVLEQRIRAERMAARGLLRYVDPDELTPQALFDAIGAELDAASRGERRTELTGMRGLEEAARVMLEHVGLGTAVVTRSVAAFERLGIGGDVVGAFA